MFGILVLQGYNHLVNLTDKNPQIRDLVHQYRQRNPHHQTWLKQYDKTNFQKVS